jgi:hypothetical protein
MRKLLIAALVGGSLIASQAAASETDVVSVGDRTGSDAASSNDMTGLNGDAWLYLLAAAGLIGAVAYESQQHDVGSNPASP